MCGYGGIGRRSALRMLWRNPWGFKSPYPHHFLYFFMHFLLARKIIILLAYLSKGMKGLRWLFSVCLGILAFCNAYAWDMDDVARAASRAIAQKTSGTVQSRGVPTSSSNTKTTTNSTGPSRSISGAATRDRTTTTATDTRSAKNVAARTTSTTPRTTTQNVSARTTNIVPRSTTTNTGVARRTATNTSVKTRSAKPSTRTGRARSNTSRSARTISRAATNESGALIANYSGCRQVYYECMDEFCATKDTNLRRCACSSRVNEFNSIKKQMSKFEDQMLDFNQRLLLVNMDAEDVDAINNATEGEEAFYNTKDRTKSKKALDEIAKKLNTTFGDSDSVGSLAPISMSLNIDSAFDTVDSFMGVDTTAKTGPALYNAAIPVCREIATEVCNEDELSLAVSGYQMLMEQDCNTVYKSYQSQVDSARAKVFESSALLDMSRLEAYQTRNSDDLLTCKRKMLEMLTDSTVCGTNLQNCLDMTGKYIDPTTGSAFLTTSLTDLDSLIIRPTTNQTWTSANSSSPFLTYLKNKKNYLATAMENCQDIADSVWDGFIEDALSQIKLAQTAKLEEIRQACTTLTTECITSTSETIAGFDARALSIFGVSADRTANSLCADVQTACTALIDSESSSSSSWNAGITDISTDKTYDTIISSCTQVGRNCIIQACKSISGNFDLCDDINFSANRHAILERTSCWSEVRDCVAAAGDTALLNIVSRRDKPTDGDFKYAFYDEMYDSPEPNPIQSLCSTECIEGTDAECATCRIAERIWGNCEQSPQTPGSNRILIPTLEQSYLVGASQTTVLAAAQSTLLAWFAINTGTAQIDGDNVIVNARSCVNTRCSSGRYAPGANGATTCLPDEYDPDDVTGDGLYCPTNTNPINLQMQVTSTLTNCCYAVSNSWGHIPMSANPTTACCETGNLNTEGICLPRGVNATIPLATNQTDGSKLLCIGTSNPLYGSSGETGYPSGKSVICNGTFIRVSGNKYTELPKTGSPMGNGTYYQPRMGYYQAPAEGEPVHDNWVDQSNTTAYGFYINYDVDP